MCPHVVKGFGTLKMVFFWSKRFDGGGQTSSLQSSSSKKVSGFWQRIFWFVFQKEKAREKLERAERCYRKCIFFQGSIFQPAMLVYRSEGANGWVEKRGVSPLWILDLVMRISEYTLENDGPWKMYPLPNMAMLGYLSEISGDVFDLDR